MRLEKAQTSERFRPRSDVRSIFRIGGAAHFTRPHHQDMHPAGHSGPDRALVLLCWHFSIIKRYQPSNTTQLKTTHGGIDPMPHGAWHPISHSDRWYNQQDDANDSYHKWTANLFSTKEQISTDQNACFVIVSGSLYPTHTDAPSTFTLRIANNSGLNNPILEETVSVNAWDILNRPVPWPGQLTQYFTATKGWNSCWIQLEWRGCHRPDFLPDAAIGGHKGPGWLSVAVMTTSD